MKSVNEVLDFHTCVIIFISSNAEKKRATNTGDCS